MFIGDRGRRKLRGVRCLPGLRPCPASPALNLSPRIPKLQAPLAVLSSESGWAPRLAHTIMMMLSESELGAQAGAGLEPGWAWVPRMGLTLLHLGTKEKIAALSIGY